MITCGEIFFNTPIKDYVLNEQPLSYPAPGKSIYLANGLKQGTKNVKNKSELFSCLYKYTYRAAGQPKRNV